MHRLMPAALLALVAFLPLVRAQEHEGHDHAPAAETHALPDTPAGRRLGWVLEQLVSKDDVETEDRFTESFFAQVPPDRLRLVFGQLRTAIGRVEVLRIDEKSPTSLVAATRAETNGTTWRIHLSTEGEEPHRIEGLLFQPAPEESVKPIASWDEADDALLALGGSASLGVYRITPAGSLEPVHTLNENEPRAIGSAFKLFVLEAVAQEVRSERLTWDTPIEIRDEWKSLPSGVMQNLPQGTEKPLSQYARQMISISDNTATDHLLLTVGREKVERAYLSRVKNPGRTLPFLTTREMFSAKLSEDGTLLARYADADEETRRAMLAPGGEIASTQPSLTLVSQWLVPQRVEAVEWFASVRELCETLVALQRMSKEEGLGEVWRALSINPGIPEFKSSWANVGFKGGSEPGVLNVTWLLERHAEKGGGWGAVSLTLNDTTKALDERTAIGLASRIVEFFDASWDDEN